MTPAACIRDPGGWLAACGREPQPKEFVFEDKAAADKYPQYCCPKCVEAVKKK